MPARRDARLNLIEVFEEAITALVREEKRDLTLRQLAVLVSCNQHPGPHTVRGLAGHFRITKSAVVRAADRLQEDGLLDRKPDPRDRRSVLLVVTPLGKSYLRRLAAALESGAASPAGRGAE